MKYFLIAAAAIFAATPARADATATCKFEKGVVTVAFSNAGPKAMQCEVNCNMAVKGGIGTVVCVKVVPPGSKDLVMCTENSDGAPWTGIKAQEVNCRDPEGTPVSPEEQKAQEKADDEDSDALIKKLQQQSIEMLKQMQQQQQKQ